jgi:hypothetical protein
LRIWLCLADRTCRHIHALEKSDGASCKGQYRSRSAQELEPFLEELAFEPSTYQYQYLEWRGGGWGEEGEEKIGKEDLDLWIGICYKRGRAPGWSDESNKKRGEIRFPKDPPSNTSEGTACFTFWVFGQKITQSDG